MVAEYFVPLWQSYPYRTLLSKELFGLSGGYSLTVSEKPRFICFFTLVFQTSPFNRMGISPVPLSMSLKSKVEAGIKNAMRSKDQDTLRALRAIKSLILLEETKGGSADELSTDDEIKLLTKAAKQRRESAEIYQAQGREDLWAKEEAELAVIEQFLPRQLGEEEITLRLRGIIEQVGAKGPSDMGKVMGVATKEMSGQADGKVISALVKSLLANQPA